MSQGYDGPASMYPPPVGQQPLSMGPPYPPGPSPSGWMNLPTDIAANCPPGLEYLCSIDQLLVHQKVELLEGTSILK